MTEIYGNYKMIFIKLYPWTVSFNFEMFE